MTPHLSDFCDRESRTPLTDKSDVPKMEAVGRLAAGVAHDFNNLLTVIKGHAEFLSRALPLEGESREDIDQITHAALKASRLTRQLLAFSRQQVMEKQFLDPNALLHDLEKLLVRLIGENIELHVSLYSGVPIIHADSGQVEQAVMNLVVNARDAMPDGGKLRIASRPVTIGAAGTQHHADVRPGSYVAIGVTDSGPGIAPELLPRIFEPFSATNECGGGTGLGLATVYGIARQLGGFVDAISSPGKGSTFTLYLPEASLEEGSAVASPDESVSGRQLILLVEDQDEVRTVARRILVTHGYKVIEARNGIEALELLRSIDGDVHLVITDAVMPRMGGPDLVRALRHTHPDLPAMIVSGYTDRQLVSYGPNELNVPFLAKPFRADDLLRIVRKAIRTAA